MGLDMTLSKKTYIGNRWAEAIKDKEVVKIGVDGVKDERVSEIVEHIADWRKANAIHAWFVENVQDGNDNCGEYYVDEEQLKELLGLVNQVLEASELVDGEVINGYTYKDGERKPMIEKGKIIKDSSVAEELLPCASGFFFGGTEYDQWYYQDLEHTKKVLEESLAEGGSYYYSSSW